jgi:hypothetical protein
MIPLYSAEQYQNAKSMDKLQCLCSECNEPFYVIKKLVTQELSKNRKRIQFCSKTCKYKKQNTQINVVCLQCNINFTKIKAEVSLNNFCSRSCAVTYNNKHKTHGTKRSKLESWIEEELSSLYPDLYIEYNQKTAIQSELDIYIPSLNLAFELNGIFHYEPIFGNKKLSQIQDNDISKSKSCIDAGIDLCIIDTSQMIHFKSLKAQKFLNIICNIIKERLTS